MHPSEYKKFTRFSPLVVMGLILLAGGTFLTIFTAQKNQNISSKASGSNILSNPGCENGTNFYKGYQAYISTTTSYPHSGYAACKVVSTGGTFYDMESLQSIPYPTYGQSYTGSAWVRSDSNSGRKIYVALRERGGYAATKTVYGSGITLTTNWQLVSTTINIQSSGRTGLDYYIVQDPGAAGHVFYADDLVFVSGSGGGYQPSYPSPTTYYAPTPTQVPYYSPTPVPTTYYPPTPTPTVYYQPTPTKTPTPTPTVYYQPTPTPTAYISPVPPTPYVTITPTPAPTAYPTSTPIPTPTYAPGSTQLAFTLGLHGIGKGGDSANPNGTGNMTPIHPQRPVIVDIFDNANTLVKTQQGIVAYDSASGLFKGTIGLEGTLANGFYTIKVKTNQFLRALVPGIHNLAAGQTFELQKTTLVNGDINNDNMVNILDYNILIGCYSDLAPAVNCASGDDVRSDITDDGDVNQYDYNLFLRELTNQGGQ